MMLTELAQRAEISIAYLSRIERERAPRQITLYRRRPAPSLPMDDLFAAARRLVMPAQR